MNTNDKRMLEEVMEVNELIKNIAMNNLIKTIEFFDLKKKYCYYELPNSRHAEKIVDYYEIRISEYSKIRLSNNILYDFFEVDDFYKGIHKYLLEIKKAFIKDLEMYPDEMKKYEDLIQIINSLLETTFNSYFIKQKAFEKKHIVFFSNQNELATFVAKIFAEKYIDYLEDEKFWAMDDRKEYQVWEEKIQKQKIFSYKAFLKVINSECESHSKIINIGPKSNSRIYKEFLEAVDEDIARTNIFYSNVIYHIDLEDKSFSKKYI